MEAKEESTSRYVALLGTVAFVALIFIPGAYYLAFGLSHSDMTRWGRWMREEKSCADALRKIEPDFDRRFLLGYAARTLIEGTPANKFPDNPLPHIGGRGFLFNETDRLVSSSAGFLHQPQGAVRATDVIIDLGHQLQRRGIHFLMVPIPAKESIYPELLDAHYNLARGPDLNADHAAWIHKLGVNGIDVLDLTEVFWQQRYGAGGLVYHPTDTHWTYRGMRLAAEEIARSVLPIVSDLPRVAFKMRAVQFTAVGDLKPLFDSPSGPMSPPDIHEQHIQLYDQRGLVRPGDEARILVLGDSYAAHYVEQGAGLSQQIMSFLNLPVQSAAGAGYTPDVMGKILSQPECLAHKRVVIMAFAIYHLVAQDWHSFSLAAVGSQNPMEPAGALPADGKRFQLPVQARN
jgi:hypothetical protein